MIITKTPSQIWDGVLIKSFLFKVAGFGNVFKLQTVKRICLKMK
jgi:hypothetical protein